jgi:hypothetical protein
MISPLFADTVLIASLIVSLAAYVQVSKRDGSYVNILTPSFVMGIPANYFFPLFYTHVIGNDAGSYSYIYVYTTIAIEAAVFAYFYVRRRKTMLRSPFAYSYCNFFSLALVFLGLALLMYAPILLEFRESLLDPRQIYRETRTGFGVNFYISTVFCYLAFICAMFSARSWLSKGSVALAATILISLHGSKGLALNVAFLLALFVVYGARRKVGWWPSLLACLGMGVLVLVLFAATMALGDSPLEVLETISGYSDYTRNAMMVIDSKIPVQYGRLTMEASVIGRIPRVLMPAKPKNFGYLYLDEVFYPQSLDQDAGVPEFGIGVQYADFGFLAIVYLAAFAALRGWLARVFVDRLKKTQHPADFFLLAFFANISLLSVGGVGWLLPEALVVAAFLYFASTLGAKKIYRERLVAPRFMAQSSEAIQG